jgi:hypothetical protein
MQIVTELTAKHTSRKWSKKFHPLFSSVNYIVLFNLSHFYFQICLLWSGVDWAHTFIWYLFNQVVFLKCFKFVLDFRVFQFKLELLEWRQIGRKIWLVVFGITNWWMIFFFRSPKIVHQITKKSCS